MQSVLSGIENVTVSAAPKKRVKKVDWKKADLTHIRDHGLSVVFADPAKTDFLRNHAKAGGMLTIEVGKSSVSVETLGRVSRVYLKDAIGNGFQSLSLSYFSLSENLNFTFLESGDDSRHASQLLQQVVFGNVLPLNAYGWRTEAKINPLTPSVLACQSGAQIDYLRAGWVANWGWALLGENGMRARAISEKSKQAAQAVAGAESQLSYWRGNLETHNRADYPAERANARNVLKSALGSLRNRADVLGAQLAICEAALSSDEAVSALTGPTGGWGVASDEERAFNLFGARVGRRWAESPDPLPRPSAYQRTVYFAARHASYSVPFYAPNYTVSRGGDGSLRLSSGIVCPFAEAEALAWLRNEAPAPKTQYGTCHLIRTCYEDGRPRVLVGCGCHRVDVARDLGGEFVELLRPSHSSALVSGVAQLDLTPETRVEFLARIRAEYAKSSASLRASKAEVVRAFAVKVKEVGEREANHSAYADSLRAKIAEAEARLSAEKASAEALKKGLPGGDLETALRVAKSALSALTLGKL